MWMFLKEKTDAPIHDPIVERLVFPRVVFRTMTEALEAIRFDAVQSYQEQGLAAAEVDPYGIRWKDDHAGDLRRWITDDFRRMTGWRYYLVEARFH